MNIFFLDENVTKCAQYHCDKHVVKMILEYAQLLSTAHRELDGSDYSDLYKSTHVNHPCGVWVRKSSSNYKYLYDLFCAICDEYTYRYGRTHLTDTKLRTLLSKIPVNLTDHGITFRPKCMPDEYKVKDVVQSYRNYYIEDKKSLLVWTGRDRPEWVDR